MSSVIRSYWSIHPKDRAAWRAWLTENHDRSPGVWVTFFKKLTGKRTFTYEEAIEEALCFGWIDSQADAVDEERYKQVFTPRKKGSNWSKTNKGRVERLIAQGLMTPAGMAKVEEAKADGSWNRLDDVDELVVPDDLAMALRANHDGESNFSALSASKRRQILWYLASAKRPETRERRVAEIVGLVSEGLSMEDLLERRRSGPGRPPS